MPDKKAPTDEALEARVAALEEQVTNQQIQIADLETDTDSLDERVTALEGEEPPVDPDVHPEHPIVIPPEPPPIDPDVHPEHPIVIPPEVDPPPVEGGVLRAELRLPTGTLTFSEAEAEDLGNYEGEFVRQRCLLQRQGSWLVFFRPDVDGQRDEVVVEYGLWPLPAGQTASHVMDPFTVVISKDEQVIATVDVPHQYWMTRWRWQSAPRPIVRSHDDLVARKAILPLGDDGLYGQNPPDYSMPQAVWNGPGSTGGVMIAMGTTGDRQELGPITNLQGSYLMRGNEAARTGMLAQAEAVGTFPFWLRDSATDACIDIYEHPFIGFNNTANSNKYPKIYPAVPRNSAGQVPADFFTLNVAHFPQVAFVPWCLTDDPYFLEGVQMTAQYICYESNYYGLQYNLPGVVSANASRALAWGMRSIADACYSPENVPSWLKPGSYFKRMMADNLTYANVSLNNTGIKVFRVFHHWGNLNYQVDPWMLGYLMSALGRIRWSHMHPEWDETIDWLAWELLGFVSDVADGGWDRRRPSEYAVPLTQMRRMPAEPTYHGTNANPQQATYADDGDTPDDWGELWRLYQEWAPQTGLDCSVGPEDKIYDITSMHYQEVVSGATAALALGGVPGARERHDWLRAKMPQACIEAGGSGPAWKPGFRYAYAV